MIKHCAELKQTPQPGQAVLAMQGDILTVSLELAMEVQGQAWLRTNLGRAKIRRREIIREVERNQLSLGLDWHDLPMTRTDATSFALHIGLHETGHFEGKCYLIPKNSSDLLWPVGENFTINVEPAITCAGNTIYNAFVRLFGPNCNGKLRFKQQPVKELEDKGFTVIPPSGTFRDLGKHLEFIFNTLGCRFLQLLPIHPTPTTYARMGRFGSPYAALSFTAVDPALAVFDPKATPLEQFMELVDRVHGLEGKIILDIAINHTGWAADLHEKYPEWLARDPEGKIEQPGAWGVIWADLTRLDYRHKELWQYIAEIFLTWCKRGVDGFRCDAGYMIPQAAWTYIIARVREHFPETIFFLEGLGGPLYVTNKLLDQANFNWAYSELFQNYTQDEITKELQSCNQTSLTAGLMIHFAETHDNNRLAATSKTFAKMRTALCALSSFAGGFGFANGVEWFATEKINVHEATSLNWGNPENQVQLISRLNRILATHPAFFHPSQVISWPAQPGQSLALIRKNPVTGHTVLIIANLDSHHSVQSTIDRPKEFAGQKSLLDLLSGEAIKLNAGQIVLDLHPGQVYALSPGEKDLKRTELTHPRTEITRQRLQAKVIEIKNFLYPGQNWLAEASQYDPPDRGQTLQKEQPGLLALVQKFRTDPLKFCQEQNPHSGEPMVITWNFPQDLYREVMIPPGHFLLIRSSYPFRADICQKKEVIRRENSLPLSEQGHCALFLPLRSRQQHLRRTLKLTLYTPEGPKHGQGQLLYLTHFRQARVQKTFAGTKALQRGSLVLLTNPLGAVSRAYADWGSLASRYDGLLCVPPDPAQLNGRQVILSRIRGWIVHQGYSQALELKCLQHFSFDLPGEITWKFNIPCGQGKMLPLLVRLCLEQQDFCLRITFTRDRTVRGKNILGTGLTPLLILRPDIEDRNFHETTKAYKGPEELWPQKITCQPTGFIFQTSFGACLKVHCPKSSFVAEAEWQYMVRRTLEEERGLDPFSDLYSPGYFQTKLDHNGQGVILQARLIYRNQSSFYSRQAKEQEGFHPLQTGQICKQQETVHSSADIPLSICPIQKDQGKTPRTGKIPIGPAMEEALIQFLVNKGSGKTIIAGYPWFLDWGRDTLIVCRGLLATGKTRTVLDIVQGLAHFEHQGTLPNMIQGQDTSNRDTSDAPLWLFTVCADLQKVSNDNEFIAGWKSPTGKALLSIVKHYIQGTENGIKMDPETGLVFSPAHFTWMDTNYPAGTPRQGYPIEIQALWFAALNFLARFGPGDKNGLWEELAKQVQDSVQELFLLDTGYLADCLLADPRQGARQGRPDNALRPNQLLAITLGLLTEQMLQEKILLNCLELLVPGGIRSLADRDVCPELPIWFNGQLLNDPKHPYQGHYLGPEDTGRKPAYHNGTAWTWLFPSFCEAWVSCFGPQSKSTALSWLGSSSEIINRGCLGQVPEIMDGNFPHQSRGCDAQAWGCSELLRVWTKLMTL